MARFAANHVRPMQTLEAAARRQSRGAASQISDSGVMCMNANDDVHHALAHLHHRLHLHHLALLAAGDGGDRPHNRLEESTPSPCVVGGGVPGARACLCPREGRHFVPCLWRVLRRDEGVLLLREAVAGAAYFGRGGSGGGGDDARGSHVYDGAAATGRRRRWRGDGGACRRRRRRRRRRRHRGVAVAAAFGRAVAAAVEAPSPPHFRRRGRRRAAPSPPSAAPLVATAASPALVATAAGALDAPPVDLEEVSEIGQTVDDEGRSSWYDVLVLVDLRRQRRGVLPVRRLPLLPRMRQNLHG